MSNEKGLSLWMIDAGIEQALEALCDEDGVIDEEVEARLAELELARPQKIENCALFVKNRRALAAAIREEEKTLAERRRKYEADAERVEGILERSLGGERFETARVAVTWRTSQAVEIDDGAEIGWSDADAMRFLVYSHRINKDAVKKALKSGEAVPGARMVERLNMGVK